MDPRVARHQACTEALDRQRLQMCTLANVYTFANVNGLVRRHSLVNFDHCYVFCSCGKTWYETRSNAGARRESLLKTNRPKVDGPGTNNVTTFTVPGPMPRNAGARARAAAVFFSRLGSHNLLNQARVDVLKLRLFHLLAGAPAGLLHAALFPSILRRVFQVSSVFWGGAMKITTQEDIILVVIQLWCGNFYCRSARGALPLHPPPRLPGQQRKLLHRSTML